MANWQRKSDYLLREIVKFQTYSESLAGAQVARERVYARKEELAGAERAREEERRREEEKGKEEEAEKGSTVGTASGSEASSA